jgi:CubicO group peptidase (beta-lactamase class C family)
MKKGLFLAIFITALIASNAQPSYFPPTTGSTWETTNPSVYGWCQPRIDSLYNYLEAENSKAFILLVDGKIVLEQYFNGHTAQSLWYWASAGKTLTAFMTGIAQQEGYLSINDTTSTYLGQGWTNCTPEQEQKITIKNQLSMTSGLDDTVDPYCTLPSCLNYLAEPGERWAYHNGPYTLLDGVIENATGITLNQYTTQKVKTPTGMNGTFIMVDYNNVFFSTARSMARFGLLIQNNGNWDGNQIMTDSEYFNEMVNTSQNLNESYGYLWWLNGKPSFMVPGLQLQIPGSLMQNAPNDVIMALGKDGQFINVNTGQNMVWIRMGDSPDGVPVDFLMNDIIWDYINQLTCEVTGLDAENRVTPEIEVFPNPFRDKIQVLPANSDTQYTLFNTLGQGIWSGTNIHHQNFSNLYKGLYILKVNLNGREQIIQLIKE